MHRGQKLRPYSGGKCTKDKRREDRGATEQRILLGPCSISHQSQRHGTPKTPARLQDFSCSLPGGLLQSRAPCLLLGPAALLAQTY